MCMHDMKLQPAPLVLHVPGVMDMSLHVYLQVNLSPGLHRSDVPLEEQYLPRQLVHDLLNLKGLAPGGAFHPNTHPGLRDVSLHPDAVTVGAASCQEGVCNSEAKCDARPECGLCHRCRTEDQDRVLSALVAEHRGGELLQCFCIGQQLCLSLQ
jgi:hypothetical protein